MQASDVGECISLLASHPLIGARFEGRTEQLRQAWLHLIQSNAISGCVFFAEESAAAPICFAGITAVVNDAFLLEMKTAPHFWIGPEIARRIAAGKSPLVSDRELRDGNSRGGLNLVCLENCVHGRYSPMENFSVT